MRPLFLPLMCMELILMSTSNGQSFQSSTQSGSDGFGNTYYSSSSNGFPGGSFSSSSSSSSMGEGGAGSDVFVAVIGGSIINYSNGSIQTSSNNGIVSINSPVYGSFNSPMDHDFVVVNDGLRLIERPVTAADRTLIQQRQTAFQNSFAPMAPMRPMNMTPMQPMAPMQGMGMGGMNQMQMMGRRR